MKKKSNKTTPKHFEIFKKECEKWVNILNLKCWDIEYRHVFLKDNVIANCTYWRTAKNCVIQLSTEWINEPLNNRNIRRTAFHEVLELFFARFREIARDRAFCYDDLEEENHSLIQTLLNVLWEKYEKA